MSEQAPRPDDGEPNANIVRSLAEKIAPKHTALLIIDMLNDFLDPQGKTPTRAKRPIGAARAVIPVQAKIIDAARRSGVTIVYVNHTTLANGSSASAVWLDARGRATYSTTDVCSEGTWGGEVIEELRPHENDVMVQKFRYSGFAGTNLDLILRSLAIRTVICAGVSTNVCVEATAREAFSNDYYVVYAEDACASWDMELHAATLKSAAHRYAVLADAETLQRTWSS